MAVNYSYVTGSLDPDNSQVTELEFHSTEKEAVNYVRNLDYDLNVEWTYIIFKAYKSVTLLPQKPKLQVNLI